MRGQYEPNPIVANYEKAMGFVPGTLRTLAGEGWQKWIEEADEAYRGLKKESDDEEKHQR